MRDHQPIPITEFNGLWARGWYDSNPVDHFSDCLNIKTVPNGFEVRDGLGNKIIIGSVYRMWIFKVYGQSDRILILDGTGTMWDSTALSVPILGPITGMTDFAAVSYGGRAYISPSNGSTGLPGESWYVYKGSGTAVKAGGSAPSGTLVATESTDSGNVESGFRVYAVAYETDTGFITSPGPVAFATLQSTGGFKVTLNGVPVGPANTVKRHILATKFITGYNGDQTGYTLYFCDTLNDNSTTTIDLSFFDSELLSDASYLLDLFTNPPATLWLTMYHGRLIGGGENSNPSVVRVSEPGQPEAINQVSGLLVIDPANTSSPVTNGVEYKDIFYVYKKSRTYSTSDNNGDPSSWNVITIDEGIGTDCHGIATISDTPGVDVDRVILAHQSGLMLFTGTYSRPEVSWKIRDLWNRINQKYFHTVQLAHDVTRQLIYCAVPLDSATSPSHILVCDYSEIDPFAWNFYKLVRWYVWSFAGTIKPTTIIVETSTTDGTMLFKLGSSAGNVYTMSSSYKDDDGTAIPTPMIRTAILGVDKERGIQHTGAVRLRIQGNGSLGIKLYDKDMIGSYTAASLTLATTPGREYDILTNFNAQGAMLELKLSAYQNWLRCNGITVFMKPIYNGFPG